MEGSQETTSKVILLGAGPGDPELLTIRGLRLLRRADAVVYDRLIPSEILRYCRKSAELIYVGKASGRHSLPQEEINALLARLARRKRLIVRLKGGDPFVFGRGGEEYRYLTERGIQCEVVPGVTAACAAAADIRVPLTDRNYSSEVLLSTGHPKSGGYSLDFSQLEPHKRTCVVYMGLSSLPALLDGLREKPVNAGLPVCVIQNASRPNSRSVFGTIENILDRVHAAGITSPALILLGGTLNEIEYEKLTLGEREATACSP